MQPSDRALVTEVEANRYLKIGSEQGDAHEMVVTLINMISDAIEDRTRKKYRQKDFTGTDAEIRDGNGRPQMWTYHKPVIGTPTVYFYDGENWDDVTVAPYSLTVLCKAETGEVYFDERHQGYPEGNNNIKIEYSTGYADVDSIPHRFKMACLKLMARYYAENQNDLHGLKSQAIEGQTNSFTFDEWPNDVNQLLGLPVGK